MNDPFLDTHPLTPFRPAHPPVLRSGGSRMAWIGGAQNVNDMAFGNRVQAHGIAAGWVGFRPPPPLPKFACEFEAAGILLSQKTGPRCACHVFLGRGPFSIRCASGDPRIGACKRHDLPCGRSSPCLRVGPEAMTLRASGLQAASSVLALESARHRHLCRATCDQPCILHRRPPVEDAVPDSGPGLPCRCADAGRTGCLCLHPSPTSPRGWPTADGRHRQKCSTDPKSARLDLEFRNRIRSKESHRAVTPAQSASEGRCGFRDQ